MMNKKAAWVAFAALVGAVLGSTTAAWACTGAQAQVSILPRSAAIMGEPVKVVSNGFSPSTPVEIRWNSATGPVVGSEVGPDNSVAVQIPADAKPGLYYLVVMQPDGSKLGAGSFEVLASETNDTIAGGQSFPTTQRVSADLWGGFSSSPSADVSIEASPAESGSPAALMGLGLVAASSAALMFALVFVGMSALDRSRRGTAPFDNRAG